MTQHGPDQIITGRAARGAVLTAAGLAGAASLVALAAPAQAAPAQPLAQQPSADESTTTKAPAPKRQLAANYGRQKLRVGIQSADGAVDPKGDPVDTAGTTLKVTGRGPNGETGSFTCTTAVPAPADDTNPDATFCAGDPFDQDPFQSSDDLRRAANVVKPSPSGRLDFYVIPEGWTATVEQVTPIEDLGQAPPESLPTCNAESDDVFCREPSPDSAGTRQKSTDIVLVAPGVPPVAKDDSATTRQDTAVTIDIQDNDKANAPITGVEIGKQPGHGTASLGVTDDEPVTAPSSGSSSGSSSAATTTNAPAPVITLPASTDARRVAGARKLAAVSSYQATYTPAKGFVGTDRFSYTITTANGSSTAAVTVTISGGSAGSSTAVSSSSSLSAAPSSDSSTPRDPIAQTGTDSGELLTYGVGLLAVGGVATAMGTRRRRGRHAR